MYIVPKRGPCKVIVLLMHIDAQRFLASQNYLFGKMFILPQPYSRMILMDKTTFPTSVFHNFIWRNLYLRLFLCFVSSFYHSIRFPLNRSDGMSVHAININSIFDSLFYTYKTVHSVCSYISFVIGSSFLIKIKTNASSRLH